MILVKVHEFLQRRTKAKNGVLWPWWIPVGVTLLAVGAACVAVAQRDPVFPPGLAEVLGLLAIVAWLGPYLSGWTPPPVVLGVMMHVVVVGVMLVEPVALDFAPMLLTLLAGELAATSSVRLSAAFAVLSGVTLVVLDLTTVFGGSLLWVVAIAVAWDVGFIFQWQMKLIEQERETARVRAERAAAGERQRIAREVHDVIAHSLSIMMLHLTAARHSLKDGDADVAEATAALRDAEQLGRQSMADIRRTVGLLDGGGGTAPMPGVPEISELVAEFRNAGMDVTYELRGDPSTVPQSAALGLYRVAQESLSNVAKHARGAEVRAALDLTAQPRRLAIWNSLPNGVPEHRDADGTGLKGMRERSELIGGAFRAGPVEDRPAGPAQDHGSGTEAGRGGVGVGPVRGKAGIAGGWLVEVEFPVPVPAMGSAGGADQTAAVAPATSTGPALRESLELLCSKPPFAARPTAGES